jgi:hypothetical protein
MPRTKVPSAAHFDLISVIKLGAPHATRPLDLRVQAEAGTLALPRIYGFRLDSDCALRVTCHALSPFLGLPRVIRPINDEWYYRRIYRLARSI